MLEYFTRITTSPAVSASTAMLSKPAAILPSRSWMRNALNELMSGPAQPVLDALAIQLDVVVEQPVALSLVAREAVRVEPGAHHRKHSVPKLARAVRRVAIAQPEVREGEDAFLHLAREPVELRHFRVVRQEYRPRVIRHELVDRVTERFRVEVNRRRGREDEGASVDVEVAVGKAEGIAGKDELVRAVDDAVMVQRMPGRVDQLELAAAERDARAVLRREDARLRDRHDVAEERMEAVAPEHDLRALDQLGGLDEVAHAAG